MSAIKVKIKRIRPKKKNNHNNGLSMECRNTKLHILTPPMESKARYNRDLLYEGRENIEE
jgi:hypothetical protein